ncbi:MAG: QueT transporter family protein [Bacillota bacterium]|nr:QueT transporter family protein [Bacillota bacterium]
MKRSILFMARAAVIAAAYVVLTFPLAQIAFGPVQFRLAEALTVLAAMTPAAIPGLFLGCLLANLTNPVNLGPVDIIGGSLATLIAAWLTWKLQHSLRRKPVKDEIEQEGRKGLLRRRSDWFYRLLVLSPSVIVNALVVGYYLPYLIPELAVNAAVIALTMLSILISQAIVVYVIGLPLLLALEKLHPAIWEDRP